MFLNVSPKHRKELEKHTEDRSSHPSLFSPTSSQWMSPRRQSLEKHTQAFPDMSSFNTIDWFAVVRDLVNFSHSSRAGALLLRVLVSIKHCQVITVFFRSCTVKTPAFSTPMCRREDAGTLLASPSLLFSDHSLESLLFSRHDIHIVSLSVPIDLIWFLYPWFDDGATLLIEGQQVVLA